MNQSTVHPARASAASISARVRSTSHSTCAIGLGAGPGSHAEVPHRAATASARSFRIRRPQRVTIQFETGGTGGSRGAAGGGGTAPALHANNALAVTDQKLAVASSLVGPLVTTCAIVTL